MSELLNGSSKEQLIEVDGKRGMDATTVTEEKFVLDDLQEAKTTQRNPYAPQRKMWVKNMTLEAKHSLQKKQVSECGGQATGNEDMILLEKINKLCHNCRHYEGNKVFRKKYYQSRKKMIIQRWAITVVCVF
jgi:flagellar biosynthesis regulator FlbT